MYAQLGDIKFSGQLGPRSETSSVEASLAEHALIDGKPRLQRTGTNLELIELSINFHASFCNPDAEYLRLRDYLDTGKVLPYIGGDGTVYGDFVIKSLNKSIQQKFLDGTTWQMSVDAELIEFVSSSTAEPKPTTTALNTDNPATSEPFTAPVGATNQTGADVVSTSALANTAAGEMSLLDAANVFRPKVERIIQQIDGVANGALKIKTAVDADPTSQLYDVTRQLSTACSTINTLAGTILSTANGLLTDIDNNNTGGIATKVATLIDNSQELIQRNKDMVTAAAGLNNLILTGNG